MTDTDYSLRKQLLAIRDVVSYNPLAAVSIVLLSLTAAVLEGISVTFLVPIIESAQQAGTGASPDSRLGSIFIQAYDTLGIPFTLEYIILAVATIIVLRFTSAFLADWLVYILRTNYVRWLQGTAFERALDARISYYDNQGSDEILNAIVKQSTYAGLVIQRAVQFTQNALAALMYAAVTFYLAPVLTVITGVVLGILAVVIREFFESGYSLGDRVAAANETIQTEVH